MADVPFVHINKVVRWGSTRGPEKAPHSPTTTPRHTGLSARTVQPWMVQHPLSTTPPATFASSIPRVVEVSPRREIPERRSGPVSEFALKRAAIWPCRSDASPSAFRYSPREEIYPPRNYHHCFGYHDVRAVAPHAFPAERLSISLNPPLELAPISPRSPRSPLASTTAFSSTGSATAVATAAPEGDVRGRRLALDRVRTVLSKPSPALVKPLGQPSPPERRRSKVVKLDFIFDGLPEERKIRDRAVDHGRIDDSFDRERGARAAALAEEEERLAKEKKRALVNFEQSLG